MKLKLHGTQADRNVGCSNTPRGRWPGEFYIYASRRRLFRNLSRVGARRVPRSALRAPPRPLGSDSGGTGGVHPELLLGTPAHHPDGRFTVKAAEARVLAGVLQYSAFMPKTCPLNEAKASWETRHKPTGMWRGLTRRVARGPANV